MWYFSATSPHPHMLYHQERGTMSAHMEKCKVFQEVRTTFDGSSGQTPTLLASAIQERALKT
jgi:hypothetical protein